MAYITGKFETKAQILAMRFAKAKRRPSYSKNAFLFEFMSKIFIIGIRKHTHASYIKESEKEQKNFHSSSHISHKRSGLYDKEKLRPRLNF